MSVQHAAEMKRVNPFFGIIRKQIFKIIIFQQQSIIIAHYINKLKSKCIIFRMSDTIRVIR